MTEWPERRKKIKGNEKVPKAKASNQSALTFLGAGRKKEKEKHPSCIQDALPDSEMFLDRKKVNYVDEDSLSAVQ